MTNRTTLADMNRIRTALWDKIYTPEKMPFEYTVSGVTYHGIPSEWKPKRRRKLIDSNIVETVVCASIPNANLNVTVEIYEYKDFPVFEWTVFFENNSRDNSKIIENFYGMKDILPAENVRLLHNNGDSCTRDSMETRETSLSPNKIFSAGTKGGRSCDGALPYYKILSNNFGYNISIGWPGQWVCQITGTENGVEFSTKQQYLKCYLKPNEKIRSARMTVMAFEGDATRGTNIWRRWYIAHALPRTRGNKLEPKVCMLNGGGGIEFTLADENNQLEAIDQFLKRGAKPDIWWLDAGWYPCKNEQGIPVWQRTGNWIPDPERFPNGLGPVGKKCDENNIQFLLWFEPERVSLDCWPKENPQEYVLKLKKPKENDWFNNQGLLYLGNDETREWLTEFIKKTLSEGNVKIYRQDFNGCPFPLDWWLENDGENRMGITENLHIQGYLRMWDDLLMDIPDLWIDSCSSGGRRNDLEAMRRAVALHPTDYGYGDHPVKQAFYDTYYTWTPYFRGMTASWDDEDGNYNTDKPKIHGLDNYAVHNSMAPAYSFGVDYNAPDEIMNYAIEHCKRWRVAADYMLYGDYYLLTPVRKSSEDYFAFQFDIEEKSEGIIEVIRNTKCDRESITLFPKNIDSSKKYRFSSPEFEKELILDGEELNRQGFTVSIPKRSGETWFYRKTDK